MNDDDTRRLLALVEGIEARQQRQLELQGEALALQREQVAIVQRQVERAEALQGRAEVLQQRSAQIIGAARKAMIVVLPILVLLIAYVSWLLFR